MDIANMCIKYRTVASDCHSLINTTLQDIILIHQTNSEIKLYN